MFSQNGEYDCEHYAYNLDNTFFYISEKDTDTLAWLKANDLDRLISGNPKVESVTLQKFDPHMGINDRPIPWGCILCPTGRIRRMNF